MMRAHLDLRGRQRHRAGGAAMKGAPKGDHRRPAGGRLRQLDGPFDRLGAAVAEEDLIEPGRHVADDGRRQVEHRAMAVDVGLGVEDLAGLLAHRRHHARVAVAGVGDGDAGGEVEVAPAGLVPQLRAQRVVDDDLRRLGQHGRDVVGRGARLGCHRSSSPAGGDAARNVGGRVAPFYRSRRGRSVEPHGQARRHRPVGGQHDLQGSSLRPAAGDRLGRRRRCSAGSGRSPARTYPPPAHGSRAAPARRRAGTPAAR